MPCRDECGGGPAAWGPVLTSLMTMTAVLKEGTVPLKQGTVLLSWIGTPAKRRPVHSPSAGKSFSGRAQPFSAGEDRTPAALLEKDSPALLEKDSRVFQARPLLVLC